MKKFLLGILTVFFVVGCGCKNMNTAKVEVEKYLDRYRTQDSAVMEELDRTVAEEELTDAQKEIYRDIMIRQYKDLKYDVTNETYDGDTAVVSVKVTVYDLYKVQKDAENYQKEHPEEFNDESNAYDKTLFLDYKLEQMKKNTDTVEYTIDVHLTKEDGKWKVEQLTKTDLEKIHGIYNYEG